MAKKTMLFSISPNKFKRILHKGLILIIPICLTFFVTGCDKWSSYSYSFTNKSSTEIKIIVSPIYPSRTDTFQLGVGESTAILVNTTYGTGPVRDNPEKEDTLRKFHSIKVYKIDNTKSKTNFVKTNKWSFKKSKKWHADFGCQATDDDF